jgi:hypothetical protein
VPEADPPAGAAVPTYPQSTSHNGNPAPVRWDPGRDARGARTSRGPRCPAPACPVRWRGGADRLCPDHAPAPDPPPLPGLAALLLARATVLDPDETAADG